MENFLVKTKVAKNHSTSKNKTIIIKKKWTKISFVSFQTIYIRTSNNKSFKDWQSRIRVANSHAASCTRKLRPTKSTRKRSFLYISAAPKSYAFPLPIQIKFARRFTLCRANQFGLRHSFPKNFKVSCAKIHVQLVFSEWIEGYKRVYIELFIRYWNFEGLIWGRVSILRSGSFKR